MLLSVVHVCGAFIQDIAAESTIQKVKMHGINVVLVMGIQNCLPLRRQRAVVAGCYSGWRSGTSRILQGSVLRRTIVKFGQSMGI